MSVIAFRFWSVFELSQEGMTRMLRWASDNLLELKPEEIRERYGRY